MCMCYNLSVPLRQDGTHNHALPTTHTAYVLDSWLNK